MTALGLIPDPSASGRPPLTHMLLGLMLPRLNQAGDVAQLIKGLPSMHKALGSIPGTSLTRCADETPVSVAFGR